MITALIGIAFLLISGCNADKSFIEDDITKYELPIISDLSDEQFFFSMYG
ncbi:MAG: hypothetical protein ACE3L7_30240 [Candidatus Pristimantibacillus sp.]